MITVWSATQFLPVKFCTSKCFSRWLSNLHCCCHSNITMVLLVLCPDSITYERRGSGGLICISCHQHKCEMSNQIADGTIKSCYVIKEQNGHLDFIPKFAIFVQKRKLYASALRSFKDWAQQKKKVRPLASLCEGRMLLETTVTQDNHIILITLCL